MSDDGRFAFVVIAMIGNPFSPWYARARAAGEASPLAHAAMNVCLYAPGARRWALTERAIAPSALAATSMTIGASTIGWEGDALVVALDERTSPGGESIRGRLVFEPSSCAARAPISLDGAGDHAWWPVAPRGRFSLELIEPRLGFSGSGYHDVNAGRVALESSFARWSWSRAPMSRDRALLAYDVVDRAGSARRRAWVAGAGGLEAVEVPSMALAPSTWFRIRRETRGEDARVSRTLEDTPFYARSLVETRALGERLHAIHEALSLDRFRARWVRALLGYRMAREP